MNTAAPRPAAQRARMDWIDLIKATSVVLVVFLHVTQTLDFAAGDAIATGAWNGLMKFLEPLRMPIFFTVSGILAASAVKRPWSQTKGRTIGILYLFVLWHTLMTLFAVGVELATKGELSNGLAETVRIYALQLFLTPGGYWYFYALALYFVIAVLVRRFNPWVVLAIAALVNLARPLTHDVIQWLIGPFNVPNMFGSVVMNLVYFLAGVYLASVLKDLAARNDSRVLAGAATLAVGGSLLRMINQDISSASFLPIAAAWIVTGVLLAVRLAEGENARRFANYVGPRTLPIFVIQFPVLFVVYRVLGAWGDVLLGNPILQLVYPVVMSLFITALALWIYDKAMASRSFRWLFKAPKSWTAPPAPAAVGRQSEQTPEQTTGPVLDPMPSNGADDNTGELREVTPA